MQTSKLNAQIKPSLWQMFVYCFICFCAFFILQLYFHYQAYIRYSQYQCNGLLDSSALNINYRNEAGIKSFFSDIDRNWLHAWRIRDQAQGFSVSGINNNSKTNVYPKISTQCTQPANQYLELELTTQVQISTSEGIIILLLSCLSSGILFSYLLFIRNERKENQLAMSEFFYEIALHRNSQQALNNKPYSSITQQLNDNKTSLLNYLDDVQHRLQRVDEEFTEQLMLHNRELEERYTYLEIQTRELKSLTTKKSSFFANLSHDFRTPLYTLHGYIRLLNDEDLTQEQRKHTRALEGAYKNLSELVTNFLSMSRLEAGSMNIETSKFNLSRMLHEIIDGMCFLLPDKNNILLLDISSEVPSELIVDGNKLRQIITNLMTNAAKYTENGVIYIHCDSSKIDNKTVNLNISVADTGKGIPEEELKTIFDPYIRLERDRTTIPGTGLGLGICKELCSIINARLDVESIVNQGTIFSVNLVANKTSTEDSSQLNWSDIHLQLFCSNQKIEQHLIHLLSHMQLPYTMHDISDMQKLADKLDDKDKILFVLDKNHSAYLDEIHYFEQHGRNVIVSINKEELSASEKSTLKSFVVLSNVITNQLLADALNESKVAALGPQKTLNAKSLSDYRILLAEDNDLNRYIIEDTLKKLGATVISCADGAAALDLYSAGKYSAILLDAHMPKLGGTEVTQIIRTEYNDKKSAIIGITASTSSTEYQHFIHSGMSDCLIKPLNDEELVNAITSLGEKFDRIESDINKLVVSRTDDTRISSDSKQSINLELKMDDKLLALINKGIQSHKEKLKFLISAESIDWLETYNEVHRLNGSLSIGNYQEIREYCQLVENKLRNFTTSNDEQLTEKELLKPMRHLINQLNDTYLDS